MPYFYNEILHARAGELSVVIGSAFIGMMLGSILIPKLQKEGALRKTLLFGWCAAGGANLCFALPVLPMVLPLLTVHQVSAFLLFFSIILGLGLVSINIPVTVIVQKTLDDEFRGRVWAVLGSLNGAMMPLAYVTGGLLARLVPLYVIFLVGGTVIISVPLFLSRLPDLRRS